MIFRTKPLVFSLQEQIDTTLTEDVDPPTRDGPKLELRTGVKAGSKTRFRRRAPREHFAAPGILTPVPEKQKFPVHTENSIFPGFFDVF
jgi:hypothetical protein